MITPQQLSVETRAKTEQILRGLLEHTHTHTHMYKATILIFHVSLEIKWIIGQGFLWLSARPNPYRGAHTDGTALYPGQLVEPLLAIL